MYHLTRHQKTLLSLLFPLVILTQNSNNCALEIKVNCNGWDIKTKKAGFIKKKVSMDGLHCKVSSQVFSCVTSDQWRS
jgi:hypothetical protein